MMLFNKEQLTDAKIRFLFKYENLTADPNDNILDFYFRDSVPDNPAGTMMTSVMRSGSANTKKAPRHSLRQISPELAISLPETIKAVT